MTFFLQSCSLSRRSSPQFWSGSLMELIEALLTNITLVIIVLVIVLAVLLMFVLFEAVAVGIGLMWLDV